MFYTWLIIAIILSIIEMITINLVSIWFVFSSLASMIISLFTNNLKIQVAIFILLGTFLMIFTKKIVKKMVPIKSRTNIDRIIGMNGIVTEKITKNHPGEVKVDGKRWTAIAEKSIDKDCIIKVLEIDSTKLKVKRLEE